MKINLLLLLLISVLVYALADVIYKRVIFVRVEVNSLPKFFFSDPDTQNYFVSTRSFGTVNFSYFAFPSDYDLDLKNIKIFENLNRKLKKICSLKCNLGESCVGFAYEDDDQNVVGCTFIREDDMTDIAYIHPDLERKTVFFRSEDYFDIYNELPNQLPNPNPPSAKLHMIKKPDDWLKAREICNEKFRGLTTLRNSQENIELKNFVQRNSATGCSNLFWTAGRRKDKEKAYLWHTAARKKRPAFKLFTNWINPADMDRFGCVAMRSSDGLWQPRNCLDKFCYACEV